MQTAKYFNYTVKVLYVFRPNIHPVQPARQERCSSSWNGIGFLACWGKVRHLQSLESGRALTHGSGAGPVWKITEGCLFHCLRTCFKMSSNCDQHLQSLRGSAMIYHITSLFSVADVICASVSGSCMALWSSSLTKARSLLQDRREAHNWKFHSVSQEPEILSQDKTFPSFLPAFSALICAWVCHVLKLSSVWPSKGGHQPSSPSPEWFCNRKCRNPDDIMKFLLDCHSAYPINRKLLELLKLDFEPGRPREPFLIW